MYSYVYQYGFGIILMSLVIAQESTESHTGAEVRAQGGWIQRKIPNRRELFVFCKTNLICIASAIASPSTNIPPVPGASP